MRNSRATRMAIKTTIAHITIKVLEVIRVFDEFSQDSDIGLGNIGELTPRNGWTKPSPGEVRFLMQPLNSARRIIKSSPCISVLPAKVTVILIGRSFEFLFPVFNSCDNFGPAH